MRYLLLLIWLSSVMIVRASDGVRIPDPKLKARLLALADKDKDGLISQAEAAEVEDLDCSNMGIRSLEGIEAFTGLLVLDCSFNHLKKLPDLSSLKELEFLRVDHNQLWELPPLDKLTHLRWLYVFNNQLTRLPKLDQLPNLTRIIALNNQLESLPDLSKQEKLQWLWIENNRLTQLPDLTPLTGLQELTAYGNPLTTSGCAVFKQTEGRELKIVLNPLWDAATLDCTAAPPVVRPAPPQPPPKQNMLGRVVTTLRTAADMVMTKLRQKGLH